MRDGQLLILDCPRSGISHPLPVPPSARALMSEHPHAAVLGWKYTVDIELRVAIGRIHVRKALSVPAKHAAVGAQPDATGRIQADCGNRPFL